MKRVKFLRTTMDKSSPTDPAAPLPQETRSPDYRQLFNLVPQAIALARVPLHRLEIFNDRFCELTGYTAEEIQGRTVTELELYARDSRARLIEALERAGTLSNWELSLKVRGDRIINTAVFARQVRIGEHDYHYLAFTDETDRRRIESHLQQTQKMEALGTMVAGMAHEINNPINLITFNINLLDKVWRDVLPILEQTDKADPQRKYGGLSYRFLAGNIGQMHHDMGIAATRISKIITDLKNFSKRTEITDIEPVQINEAVENALRLAQPSIKTAGVAVNLSLSDRLPRIMGNQHNIEQIILNLVLNAVQAIDHNNGRIDIRTGYDNGDDRIFLHVRDNGRGIAPSIENKIFDPFVTDRLHEGGTGLGLAVTYSLTKAHDGDIQFETRAKRGTVFKVSFPSKRKSRGARILIVDDEKWNRELLITTLTQERDYIVDEAANGVEACIKLGSYQPDMLILDMFMPHMDGLEVCRTIRNTPELAGMVVLLTTGFPGHPKLDEAAELGFTNVFFKPIKMEDLLRRVDALLSPGL